MRCPRCWRRVPAAGCREHGPVDAPPGEPLPSPPRHPIPGAILGEPLAVGGSAQVFACDGDRVVKWGRWRDTELRARFAHEAAVLRQLTGGIGPRLHQAGVVDGWPYLVLERVRGATLAEVMCAPMAAPIDRLRQLADVLATLHGCGVVHADAKPENVIVAGDVLRVLDFGLALTPDHAPPGAPGGGTLHYLAPEQIAGAAITSATDVYALGAIGFELITGRPPFVGDRPTIEYGHQLCRPPRARELAAVPPALDELLAACLAKDPRRRPAAAAVSAALASLDATRAATSTPRLARPSDRGPAAVLWIKTADRIGAARVIASYQGKLVRERPQGTLAVFTWLDHDAPLAAALTAAHELCRLGASVALHVALVEGRQRGGGLRLYGDALDRPERWTPSTAWSGLVVTRAVNPPGLGLAECATHPGFRRVVDEGARSSSAIATVPELVARDGLIAEVAAAVGASLRTGEPRLVTIVGGSGAGKTRILDELAARASTPGWRTLRVAGAPPLVGRGHAGAVLARALGADSLLPGLRAAAERGAVVLVDDAHWIEDEVLDALETAAGWPEGRLAVVVTALPQLHDGRPRWGAQTAAPIAFHLPALSAEAAHRLLGKLLQPALRVPTPLLERLAARAQGNPGALVAIADELHQRGLIRRHPDSDDWYVAADEIDFLHLEPNATWRAARALAALPPGLAELYRLLAMLGPQVELAEAEAVQAALPAGAFAIDAGSGVDWLERHGWLRRSDGALAPTNPGLAEAARLQLDLGERATLHRAAYQHWQARTGAADDGLRLERVAHHGAGCGEPLIAGHACLTLARAAAERLAHVEAERLASRAMTLLGPVDPLGAAAAGLERARARCPLSLFEAARADLAAVRTAARTGGDRVLEIEALIADGAVCDFADWLAESAVAVETAAGLADDTLPRATTARLRNWLGVVRARQERNLEAAALLEEARALADEVGDYPVAVGSRFMLGALHRRRGDARQGLVAVDEALAMSRRRGDVFHQTVGLFNRINYGIALGDPAQAAADCAAAIELAECHGYGEAEFRGWCNLANVRIQQADPASARDAARRAYAVARRRFGKHPPVVATLVLSALEVGLGDAARARALLDPIDRHEVAANAWTTHLLHAIELTIASAPAAAWAPIEQAIAHAEPEDRAILAWLRERVSA